MSGPAVPVDRLGDLDRAADEEHCTFDEWFVVLLARTIQPRETVFHGFASLCAQVAMHVARRTTAPEATLVEGAMYAINPDPPFIPPTSNDASLSQGAVYSMRFEEFFDAAVRGDVDRMFLSGGQIDTYGNTNVTAIGPGGAQRPKVKLGGGGGGCNLAATVRHLTLWTTHHRSGRALVADCDFVTDMGHRTPAGTRAELGYTGGGPQWLVTELGVFDFADGRARLREVFPDVTLDEVRSATGFPFDTAFDTPSHIAGSPDIAPPSPVLPSPVEVAAVRAVDPLAVRRLEFDQQELDRVFPLDGAGCPAQDGGTAS